MILPAGALMSNVSNTVRLGYSIRRPRAWIAMSALGVGSVRPNVMSCLGQFMGLRRTDDQLSESEMLPLRVQPDSSARFQMLSRLMSALLPLG